MKMFSRRWLMWLLLGLLALPAWTAELRVAAASDLAFVMPGIVAGFEKQSGATVKVSLGSSGNFTAQIQNGAPFDVFMAADISYPRTLIQAGLADPASLYVYGAGRIVVWVPEGSELDFERGGMRVLLDSRVKKIAIANPQHAPYGRAAMAALNYYRLESALKPKLVLGENISQAAQFVQSGNADAGIVALSLVVAPAMREKGKYWLIPESSYPPLEQAAVALKNASDPALARAFVDYLRSPAVVELLRRYGFEVYWYRQNKCPVFLVMATDHFLVALRPAACARAFGRVEAKLFASFPGTGSAGLFSVAPAGLSVSQPIWFCAPRTLFSQRSIAAKTSNNSGGNLARQ